MSNPIDPATLALHADDALATTPDIAPPIQPSTTYRAGNEAGLVYTRDQNPTRERLEAVLGALEGGHAVVYASGQAATFAALDHYRPGRVAIDRGYYGTHEALHAFPTSPDVVALDADPAPGDLVWLETPKNPTCDIEDIAAHAKRAHEAGAVVVVDSTLATPVLQNPLALGADLVLHSTTKFISGHSDALGGVLVAADAEAAEQLRAARSRSGAVPGVLETWLTLRSVRTLALRVERQSATAAAIAAWLVDRVPYVWHPSLPDHPGHGLAGRQMRGGGGVLSFELADEAAARALPDRLRLFHNATSLGGVESLIEWRHQHDANTSPRLLRISAGLEAAGDLIADLEAGLS